MTYLQRSHALHRLRIELTVPYHGIKKNNRVIHGRGERKWIGKNKRLVDAENYLTLALRSFKNQHRVETFTRYLMISFQFIMDNYYNKDGSRNKNIPDLSNLIELPQDCLQEAGIIANDGLIDSLDGSERIHGIENKLIIEIYEFI